MYGQVILPSHNCNTCLIIGAPSCEFVSSSIPSWQILTAHAQTFRWVRDLAFCLKVPLDSLLLCIGYKYQIRLTRSIWNHWLVGCVCANAIRWKSVEKYGPYAVIWKMVCEIFTAGCEPLQDDFECCMYDAIATTMNTDNNRSWGVGVSGHELWYGRASESPKSKIPAHSIWTARKRDLIFLPSI